MTGGRQQLAMAMGRSRLYDLDYQDPRVLRAAFEEGYTIEDISAAFGIATQTVTQWMDKHDVESPRARNEADS